MQEKEKDRKRLIVEEHDKVTIKQYSKIIKKHEINNLAFETIADELYDILPGCKTFNIKTNENTKPDSIDHLIVPIGDIHIGARVENLNITPKYSIEQVKKYLSEVAININKFNAKNVSLAFLGDIIESFSGLNHLDSWKSIDYGMWGAYVVKNAIEILEFFLNKVNNVKNIFAISGNHDRYSANWQEDVQGSIADLIFYFLKRILDGKINVEFDTLVISKEIDKIQYIFIHGHHKFAKGIGDEIIVNHGNNKIYNIILSCHIHTRRIIEDNRKYRWIVCPSIFTGNFYSESAGWSSTPGLLVITNNRNGKPTVTDFTLKE